MFRKNDVFKKVCKIHRKIRCGFLNKIAGHQLNGTPAQVFPANFEKLLRARIFCDVRVALGAIAPPLIKNWLF